MIILKKKSMLVVIVSSIMLSVVLVLTLIGYIAYLEIKDKEFKATYEYLLRGGMHK
ncbi:MAG: hypothetical protein PHS46_00875 [Candidatus Omnitrophica bacterium]|nr:hypothetical protein [Candidatus Omnitrophota bacterium]